MSTAIQKPASNDHRREACGTVSVRPGISRYPARTRWIARTKSSTWWSANPGAVSFIDTPSEKSTPHSSADRAYRRGVNVRSRPGNNEVTGESAGCFSARDVRSIEANGFAEYHRRHANSHRSGPPIVAALSRGRRDRSGRWRLRRSGRRYRRMPQGAVSPVPRSVPEYFGIAPAPRDYPQAAATVHETTVMVGPLDTEILHQAAHDPFR